MRGKPSRVFTEFAAAASGFDADHLHIRVTEKIVKKTDGIRPSANACKEMRGQSLFPHQGFARALSRPITA